MVKPKRKKLEAKIVELEENWKRALADYQNLEKRVDRTKTERLKMGNAELLGRLLPLLDDLERAQEHLDDDGLKMVTDKFNQLLEEEGVVLIKAEGERFNPEAMEAVEMVPGKKDRVVEVVQKGYRLEDRVLRPAQVKVGKGRLSKGNKKGSEKAERETLRGDYV